MRGHNICFCWEIRKLPLNYRQYPLISGALNVKTCKQEKLTHLAQTFKQHKILIWIWQEKSGRFDNYCFQFAFCRLNVKNLFAYTKFNILQMTEYYFQSK